MILDPLLDHAPCGFATVNDDGTVTAANATLCQSLGYERPEIVGFHIQKILPPGGRVFYSTHVFPLLKMHRIAEELYLPLRHRDGTDIPMLMNAKRRATTTGEVNDCVFVRMQQRHKYEDELLEARRLAEQASATRGKFLSMMSHDLRTPLTAISGYAELILATADGVIGGEHREHVVAIRNAAREVARLIDDILSFAQLDSGKVSVRLDRVPLDDAIARAASLLRLRMEQQSLDFQIEGCRTTSATADPDRLQQILLNLLTNATKFTPPGGRISVRCEESDDRVTVHVSDTGVGIPEDQLEHIFEPFVQLGTPSGAHAQGVGLGLAISRDLARAMGGELHATNSSAGGAVFTLVLPGGAAASTESLV